MLSLSVANYARAPASPRYIGQGILGSDQARARRLRRLWERSAQRRGLLGGLRTLYGCARPRYARLLGPFGGLRRRPRWPGGPPLAR
ncbi:hypothetical protein MBOT_09500 [Mycobacterium botniense]|uniref:Uncharacterized protein n=1 Tax=Mycobacterium botniense TaxID=84962 RepID=A0A7I9XUH2_9MYCO|nr:hypothetical protein MBOT_09500 [Mycobacterium botniense]